ncbi:MAG: hypothetical protein QXI58_07645, partial [Candidatus Micrarchaeia archaeon]
MGVYKKLFSELADKACLITGKSEIKNWYVSPAEVLPSHWLKEGEGVLYSTVDNKVFVYLCDECHLPVSFDGSVYGDEVICQG